MIISSVCTIFRYHGPASSLRSLSNYSEITPCRANILQFLVGHHSRCFCAGNISRSQQVQPYSYHPRSTNGHQSSWNHQFMNRDSTNFMIRGLRLMASESHVSPGNLEDFPRKKKEQVAETPEHGCTPLTEDKTAGRPGSGTHEVIKVDVTAVRANISSTKSTADRKHHPSIRYIPSLSDKELDSTFRYAKEDYVSPKVLTFNWDQIFFIWRQFGQEGERSLQDFMKLYLNVVVKRKGVPPMFHVDKFSMLANAPDAGLSLTKATRSFEHWKQIYYILHNAGDSERKAVKEMVKHEARQNEAMTLAYIGRKASQKEFEQQNIDEAHFTERRRRIEIRVAKSWDHKQEIEDMMRLDSSLSREDAIQNIANQKVDMYLQKRDCRLRRKRGIQLLMTAIGLKPTTRVQHRLVQKLTKADMANRKLETSESLKVRHDKEEEEEN